MDDGDVDKDSLREGRSPRPEEPCQPTLRDLFIRYYLALASLEHQAIETDMKVEQYTASRVYIRNYYRDRAREFINARASQEFTFGPATNPD